MSTKFETSGNIGQSFKWVCSKKAISLRMMDSLDSNSVVHLSDLVIDAPGLTSADSQTVTDKERRRDTSLESECCRVKAFFETCQEAHVSQGCSHSANGQSSDLQVAEVDTTSHHMKYRPEVEDITNDSMDIYEDLGKTVKEHSTADKEVTLPQTNANPDTVNHDLFNDNAMDLSLIDDTTPPGTQKYPSSFGMSRKSDSDTVSSKLIPSCEHSNPGRVNQSYDCNFVSRGRPTTSKAHNLCSSSSPHSSQSARRIVPMSSPLKSPGWCEYVRSPVRSPKVRKLIRQEVKKASAKGEMTISKREHSLSDSEVEDVNESSRLSALDLYTDELEDSVQLKYQGEIRKLQEQITQHHNKLEELNTTTGALREQLKLTEEESKKVKDENQVLRMNISRLMKTARQEMRSKHREIMALELRLKNGGNEELLRRVIPYQPYTGKGALALKDDAVRDRNIHNKRWSIDDADRNSTKRRKMSENAREAALTVMQEVKDAVSGRGYNDIVASSRVVLESHGESELIDKEQSHDSISKFSKRATVEEMGDEKRAEIERDDRQRRGRYSRSSSCEKSSRERKSESHDKDRKSHDYPSKLAIEEKRHKYQKEGNYEQDKRDRRRKRYSQSSSCEKASRESESHEKDRKSYDYLPKSAKGEKRDKHEKEGNYESKKSDQRRRRYSRSSSCEQSSRERESASHGKDNKSHENPSKWEKRDKLEKEVSRGNEKSEGRRRRCSRSSSCEKSSRERDSASHEKDRKSTREEKRGDSKKKENNERAKRERESKFCDKESDLIDDDHLKSTKKYKEWDSKSQNEEARNDRTKKRARRKETRYSRSNSSEKRSKERESVSYDKETKSSNNLRESIRRDSGRDEYYEDGADNDEEKRERTRERKTSRSSSCERSSRLRELRSHDRDSDDRLTSRRSHDYSSRSKKYDGDQLLKRSLEAERRSRSGSHERRKKFYNKDSMSPDSQSETKRRKAKEFEKTEVRRARKSSIIDHGKHTSDGKIVRLNDREKESDDIDRKYVGSRGRKKYIHEVYEKKTSTSRERRWSPDEVHESSKSKEKSEESVLRKKDERSLRERATHSDKTKPETRIYGSNRKSLDEFSELCDEEKSHKGGKGLDRKLESDEREESEEMEEDLLEVSDSGGKNKMERSLRSDTDDNNEEDFVRGSSSESYERESEEFELMKSGGIESRENSENVDDDDDEARRQRERSEPDKKKTELEDNMNSDRETEEEKDKGKTVKSCLKETLKRKRDENYIESESDSLAKSPDDVSEIRMNRRKYEHYEHGRKDLEWKDSTSELLLDKKTDAHKRHSHSNIREKFDCDEKRDLKKKSKKPKLQSKDNSMSEEICERVEEKGSAVSRSKGDSMKSHEREIRCHDVESESHDQTAAFTEMNFDQTGKTRKLFNREKLCSQREKSSKGTNVSTEEVTGLQETKEQSDDTRVESLPDIKNESTKLEENEISSESNLQSRKDSSPDANSSRKELVDMKEKKRQDVEMLRGNSSDEGSADKLQRVDEARNNSESSSDECTHTKIAMSEAVKSYSQNETVLGVQEHPLLLDNSNKSTSSSHLLSDLQMSSDTGDDDNKVQIFDELSLICDDQTLVGSDEEHKEVSNKDGQEKLLSFPDNFQSDGMADSSQEQVAEGGNIYVEEENMSKSSTKETNILGPKDEFKTDDHHFSQTTTKENEVVPAKEFSAEDRTFNNSPSEKHTLKNKFKCKRKTHDGKLSSESADEGDISSASTQEEAFTEVKSLTSREPVPGEDEGKLCDDGNGVNVHRLVKVSGQQGDKEVSTTTVLEKNKTKDILLSVLDSSKKNESVLKDSSPDHGEVSSQNGNDLSVTEHIETGSTPRTPAKGPFTFEQGHTMISCGKPFNKIVGNIPEEETRQKETEYETIQEEDAIDVYVSDSSLMDPFSPDKCKKDLFKDNMDKRKVFSPEKVKKKLSSVLVSSRGEITSRSRSSTSKTKRKEQDDLRERIVSRFAGRERSVSRMQPLSSKRELAKKCLQRAKDVQRSKPDESLSKHSHERRRHSDDLRNLILKHHRIKSASRYEHEVSPGSSKSFESSREWPDRWEKRRKDRVYKKEMEALIPKDHQGDRKHDERSVSKQRSNRNSGKIIEDRNGNKNSKSSTTGRGEKHSDYKGEKKIESVPEKEKKAKPVKEPDTSLSDGEIRSDSDENSEDDEYHSKVIKKAQPRTEKNIPSDRDEKRTRKSSRHTSSRRTSTRR